jgi:hypothetical protein
VGALAVAAAAFAAPCGEGYGPGMGRGPGMGNGMGPGMGYGMGPGAGMMMGPGYGRGGGGYGPGAQQRGDVADGNLANMKSTLKITSEQEAQWQAFTGAWKRHADNMGALREKAWQGSGTAPERMAARAEGMQQRAAEMAAMSKAFADLYAVLSPEQKAIADRLGPGSGPRGMRYGRRAA